MADLYIPDEIRRIEVYQHAVCFWIMCTDTELNTKRFDAICRYFNRLKPSGMVIRIADTLGRFYLEEEPTTTAVESCEAKALEKIKKMISLANKKQHTNDGAVNDGKVNYDSLRKSLHTRNLKVIDWQNRPYDFSTGKFSTNPSSLVPPGLPVGASSGIECIKNLSSLAKTPLSDEQKKEIQLRDFERFNTFLMFVEKALEDETSALSKIVSSTLSGLPKKFSSLSTQQKLAYLKEEGVDLIMIYTAYEEYVKTHSDPFPLILFHLHEFPQMAFDLLALFVKEKTPLSFQHLETKNPLPLNEKTIPVKKLEFQDNKEESTDIDTSGDDEESSTSCEKHSPLLEEESSASYEEYQPLFNELDNAIQQNDVYYQRALSYHQHFLAYGAWQDKEYHQLHRKLEHLIDVLAEEGSQLNYLWENFSTFTVNQLESAIYPLACNNTAHQTTLHEWACWANNYCERYEEMFTGYQRLSVFTPRTSTPCRPGPVSSLPKPDLVPTSRFAPGKGG